MPYRPEILTIDSQTKRSKSSGKKTLISYLRAILVTGSSQEIVVEVAQRVALEHPVAVQGL